MRFSVAIGQSARLGRPPARPAEAARVEPPPPVRPLRQPAPRTPQELPADLDQRVRLVGEW
jgi:hypothetical protein